MRETLTDLIVRRLVAGTVLIEHHIVLHLGEEGTCAQVVFLHIFVVSLIGIGIDILKRVGTCCSQAHGKGSYQCIFDD